VENDETERERRRRFRETNRRDWEAGTSVFERAGRRSKTKSKPS